MNEGFVNDGIRRLQAYRPGLSPRRARALYKVDSFVKLSSNENAYGPAPAVRQLLAGPWTVERYPDADQTCLSEALARHAGVDSDNIAVGAGSSELLDRIARLVLCPGRKGVYSQYAFSLYRQYILCYNAEPVEVPAHDYGHDLRAMARAVDECTSIVYIASPNNPTGTCSTADELGFLLDNIPEDVLVVVDQAYAEYASVLLPDYPELNDWHRRWPNLILTRTFSKIHALAGLRVGYLIADAGLVRWLKKIRLPFNVSQLAQEAAMAALGDGDYARQCALKNAAEMERMLAVAAELKLKPIPSAANFISYALPRPAAGIQEFMMRQGVIGRTLAEYGLDRHLRLTLGVAGENDKAASALRDSLKGV